MEYLYQGLHGHHALVPWIWSAMFMNITAFLIFLIPKTRENLITLNIGSLFIIVGVWIEKGLGLIVPGFIPDPLGEIYEYMPNTTEFFVSLGIWAFGLLIFTFFMRIAIPIQRGDFIHSKYAKATIRPQYERIKP
jgi:Ni/Fe-hydrogenase subunit HybB-like protein